jgi:hypothetical protein
MAERNGKPAKSIVMGLPLLAWLLQIAQTQMQIVKFKLQIAKGQGHCL